MTVEQSAENRDDLLARTVLAAVTEASDDAIILVEANHEVTEWGSTAERLFGVGRSEALGRPFGDCFALHVQAGMQGAVTRAMSGERIVHFESEILRGDGLPLPVWVSLSPVADADGNPWGVVAIVRDVTEQHVAQASLAEVEGRLRDAEALSHVGSWLWDLRTGAVQWSSEFHRIHGVDPFEFDGTFSSHLASVHPEDRQSMRARMEDAVATATPFECECRILRRGGGVRALRVRAHPSVGSDGSVVGLRGIGQDVTDLGGEGSVAGDQVPHSGHDIPLGDD